MAFDLTGPNGQSLFSGLTASSGPITLPASGQYTLTVHGDGGNAGSYAFALDQISVTNLSLGTAHTGTLTGSGRPRALRGQCAGDAVAVHQPLG